MLWACSFSEESTKACFIGDSITYQWDLDYFFPEFDNRKFAQNGADLEDMERWDLTTCKGYQTTVLIGTNNYSSFFEEKSRNAFVKEYVQKMKSLEANPLFIVSILPRNYLGEQDSIVNLYIDKVNHLIQNELDKEIVPYIYINAYPKFIKEGLQIRFDYFKDGLHPSFEGHQVLSAEIRRKL